MKNATTLLLAAALLSSAGCAAGFNGQHQALSIAEEHPISVDSQTVTMTMDHAAGGDLSGLDSARLRAFANSYIQDGHGALTVTAASAAQGADIRSALSAIGVPETAMIDAQYRGGSGGDVILSYTHYVATPSACGIWEGMRERDYRNMRSPNFGCATQNNIAAMIGDPHDLIAPADMTAPDSATRIRGVNAFRAGEVTSSQTDGDVDAKVSK